MKKIAIIAIQHPTEANLYLHGLRADNAKWALPGGHFIPGELPDEAANRELEEETGLKGIKLDKVAESTTSTHNLHLYHHKCTSSLNLNSQNDPDQEFVTFKWLDPKEHENLHIPKENNILIHHLKNSEIKPFVFHESDQEDEVDDGHDHFGYPIKGFIKKTENITFESLKKGKKDILQVLGAESIKPEHKEYIDWAQKLPNSNWQTWATKHYKQKPQDFTPEIKQKIEHFAGSQHIPNIAKVTFDKSHDLHSGLNLLHSAEQDYTKKLSENTNLVTPTQKTQKVVNGATKPNRHWFGLGVGSCKAEGKAMGHCGNRPSKVDGDKVLSLRTEHKVGDKTFHEPHVTFISNNGFLGEMKGRGNLKPTKEYHKDIVELLKNPQIKGIIGEGYKPKNNFHFSHLSTEHQNEVLAHNPNLITDTTSKENITKILDTKLPVKYLHLIGIIAKNPNLDPVHHAKLVNTKDFSVRSSIAKNPNLDPVHHAKLVNSKDSYIRSSIAENPNLDPVHHAKLVNDEESYVRRAIASNPNLDPVHHAKLVNDEEFSVRRAIASNPNLDPVHHAKLVNDEQFSVRSSIAENPNLDPVHHAKLVNDEVFAVKSSIASNPNLDPVHHAKLVNSKDSYIRSSIAENPNLDPVHHAKLVNDKAIDVRKAIASNPNLDPVHHAKLVNDKESYVRKAIASNPNLDPVHHAKLVNDKDSYVRKAIASNPNLDPVHHAKLVNDAKPDVREAIAENPSYIKWLENQKNESLIKMSRPKITFPQMGVGTRPDQEVQLVETPRQKKLFARKVAQQKIPDKVATTLTADYQPKEVKVSMQASRDRETKKLVNTLSGRTLGLSATTPTKPFSVTLAGKERSKFEEGDEEYKKKLSEHEQKTKALKLGYKQALDEWWNKKYQATLRGDPGALTIEELKTTKPVEPKYPRRPSKKKVDTSKLSPEKIKARGQSVDSTIHHEAFHDSLARIKAKHGQKAYSGVLQGLLSHYDKDTLTHVGTFISKVLGYKPRTPSFSEELVTHSRDILANDAKRKKFVEFIKKMNPEKGEEKAKEVIQKMKKGHQKAYEWSQKLKPEDVLKSILLSDNLNKAEDLEKGAARRLYGKFNPQKELEETDNEMSDWVTGNSESREKIPDPSPNAKLRMMNKLSSKAQVRINPQTKQREFLLHRQMSDYEYDENAKNGRINHNPSTDNSGHTSWSSNLDKIYSGIYSRDSFDKDDNQSYNHIVSAWIPESHIKTIPIQYGAAGTQSRKKENGPPTSTSQKEQEVIVNPGHNSEIHEVYKDTGADPENWNWQKTFQKSESLEKGLKGDWQKEGYTMQHSHNSDLNQHRITAFTPKGDVAGSFIFEQGPTGFMATSAHVKPEHQRKGLASSAYQLFENRSGQKLMPHTGRFGESKQSPDAEALWANPNKTFGKSEDFGKNNYSFVGTCIDIGKENHQLTNIGDASDWDRMTTEESVPISKQKFENYTGKKYKNAISFGIHPEHKFIWAELPHSDGVGTVHHYYFKNFGKSEDLIKTETKIKQLANQYATNKGMKLSHNYQVNLNPDHGKAVAHAYDQMKHDPEHPETKAAYNALIGETGDQFQHLMNSGLKISRMQPGQENPYKSSKDMLHDLHVNNHLWYYPTEQGFGDSEQEKAHPMLQTTKFSDNKNPLLANDIFRIVHDAFGHGLTNSTFGPKGEHASYLAHKEMFSPLAQKALTTETLGQNSWVNFGPKGEHNRKNPEQTIFAEQKAGLLPESILKGKWHE